MDPQSQDHEATQIISHLANGCESNDLGSVTVAIYDTAWLAMVTRTINGRCTWLFPDSFQYLLDTQGNGGTWNVSNQPYDEILNTMAALLAFIKHQRMAEPQEERQPAQLEARIHRAKVGLQRKLQNWDVESSMHVGFEVLVPALLKMLADEGFVFTFPEYSALRHLNEMKLAKLSSEMLYQRPTPLLHSLEAFIGRIDFEKLRRHRISGSMLASPASTAAYLMNASPWDCEAEDYLRKVIIKGRGEGTGGVPSVFPISIFELSWATSTLLQNGFSAQILGQENCDRIAGFLQHHLSSQDGLVGFMPSAVPDADDTAKTILALSHLGIDIAPENMITYFKAEDGHFCTYAGERDASFSANCNVLQALLFVSDPRRYSDSIVSVTGYLCDLWWKGNVRDKWNISSHYSMMLLSQALVRLLSLWATGRLDEIPELLLKTRIPLTLTQMMGRSLSTQNNDGSWGDLPCPEVTAYAVITLKELVRAPWMSLIMQNVHAAIEMGQQYLSRSQNEWTEPQYLWIEKVTYGNPILSKIYCLAAMRPPAEHTNAQSRLQKLIGLPPEAITKTIRLVENLDCFADTPPCKIKLSGVESLLFLPLLISARADILPKQKNAKNKYLNLIPLTWVLVNNAKNLCLPARLLWDMMVLTVCNFRVDEYMETTVAEMDDASLEEARAYVRYLRTNDDSKNINGKERPHEDSVRMISTNGTSVNCEADSKQRYDISDFEDVIGHYVQSMLDYPSLIEAAEFDKSGFRLRLQNFLLSHIQQIQDNRKFTNQSSWSPSQTSVFEDARTPFPTWLHTTGAESVSALMSFSFLACILGHSFNGSATAWRGDPQACFTTIKQQYLAHDLSARLAAMSRLYNDYGSIKRDRAEGNINSVNFPEFHAQAGDIGDESAKEAILKEELVQLANYEREAMSRTGEILIKDLNKSGRVREAGLARGIALFMGTASLYADVYAVQDLSNPRSK